MDRRLDDGPEHQPEPGDGQQRPDQVGPQRRVILGVGDQQEPGHDADHGDRHIDQEHRAPPEVDQQQAADDRAERDPDAAGARPEADRALPDSGLVEHIRDDGQRRRHDQRGADAHAGPGGDQHAYRTGERGPGRPGRERSQPGQERPFPADPVGQAARHQQQPGEHDHVRIDDPLQRAGGGVQVSDERGEGDVQDGVVQRDHQQRDAQHGERDPAPGGRVARAGVGRRDAAGARSHGSIRFRRASAGQGRKSPGWSWGLPGPPGPPGPPAPPGRRAAAGRPARASADRTKCPAAVVRAGRYREDEGRRS